MEESKDGDLKMENEQIKEDFESDDADENDNEKIIIDEYF